MNTASRKVRIQMKGLPFKTPSAPGTLPADLMPPEPRPAGNTVIEREVEGTPLVMRVVLNGSSVRWVLKTIAEHSPKNVNVLLQGNPRPTTLPAARTSWTREG